MPAETLGLFVDWPLPAQPESAPAPSPAASAPAAPPRFQAIDRNQLFFRSVDVQALIEPDQIIRRGLSGR